MKKLLSTAAIIAALASVVPASAQRAGPGPTANTGTGPGVLPPGGVGPSSPLKNLTQWSAAPSWTATPMLDWDAVSGLAEMTLKSRSA